MSWRSPVVLVYDCRLAELGVRWKPRPGRRSGSSFALGFTSLRPEAFGRGDRDLPAFAGRRVLLDGLALLLHDLRLCIAGPVFVDFFEDGVEAPLVAVVEQVANPVAFVEIQLAGHLADRRLASIVLFAASEHPAGRLFDFTGPLVLYVAVPVVLVCPEESDMVLIQSDRAVQHRLELVERSVRANDDVPPQRCRVMFVLDAKGVDRHRCASVRPKEW